VTGEDARPGEARTRPPGLGVPPDDPEGRLERTVGLEVGRDDLGIDEGVAGGGAHDQAGHLARWMRHMIDALERVIADGAPIDEAHAEAMRDYFRRAADMLVNSPG
jgi:hypothetical protein